MDLALDIVDGIVQALELDDLVDGPDGSGRGLLAFDHGYSQQEASRSLPKLLHFIGIPHNEP